MFSQLLIGTLMIGITAILHGVAMDFIIKKTPKLERFIMNRSGMKIFRKATIAVCVVLSVFTAHIGEVWLWASLYYFGHALPDFETCLYFSTVSFTTVGYGDVTLGHGWRLLGSIEAANGFMLFGWSTAFIFEVMSQLYRKEGEALKQ